MPRKGNAANLTAPRWKPGESGNPGGRPKKRPVTDEYFQILGEPLPESLRKQINSLFKTELLQKGATFARAGALRRALDSLLEGGWSASKEMREATEGKAPMRMEIIGTEKKVITITIQDDRKLSSTLIVQPILSEPSKNNGHS